MSAGGASMLLSLRVGRRPYLVRRDHVDAMGLVAPQDLPSADERGRPLAVWELAELLAEPALAPADQAGRRHALRINLRRRSVALLVDRIEDMAGEVVVQPLAPLLARRLARPWFLGAVALDDSPVLILDLRRIAADAALGII